MTLPSSIFTSAPVIKTAKYTCAKGHEIPVFGNGTWTALQVVSDTTITDYNYCIMCFGEWAQSKWPITREEL